MAKDQLHLRQVPPEMGYALRMVALHSDKSLRQVVIEMLWDGLRRQRVPLSIDNPKESPQPTDNKH